MCVGVFVCLFRALSCIFGSLFGAFKTRCDTVARPWSIQWVHWGRPPPYRPAHMVVVEMEKKRARKPLRVRGNGGFGDAMES